MTARTMGMATGVDTAETVRLLMSLFMQPSVSGVLNRRSGLAPYAGSADLTGVTPMVGRVSPFIGWIDGTSATAQGGYPVVLDANEDITFDAGEAGVARVDRVVGQIEDNPYDGSTFQRIRIRIVKGQASGAANPVPDSSLLLWEVTVPAGSSIGGGGFTMSTARSDKRVWTTGLGGMQQIKNGTDQGTLTGYEGMLGYRLDTSEPVIFRGGAWTWMGVPRTVIKPSNETITNNTSQNDDHLLLSGLPGSCWVDVELLLLYAAHASADIKVGWAVPNNATFDWMVMSKAGTGQANGNTGVSAYDNLNKFSEPRSGGWQNDNTSQMSLLAKGTLWTGDGGTLQLRWAQDTTNATGTIVLANSRLTGKLVGLA